MTCIWTPDPACLGDAWGLLTPAVQQRSLMLATSALQTLTNYRVGTCPITIRPCPVRANCGCNWNPHQDGEGRPWDIGLWDGSGWDLFDMPNPFQPVIRNGEWYNNCGCGTTCKPLSEVDIPGPVGYIDMLKVDGVVIPLDDGNWRLDNGHLLVWQGEGISPIPQTQDMDRPDWLPGTWSLTYSRSYPVTGDARLAVAYLAMEFAKACIPKGKCSLPRGVTSVVRSGVSFTIEAGLFPNGLTGIDIVDQFILKWNPAGSITQPAEVFDVRRGAAPRRTHMVPTRPGGSW